LADALYQVLTEHHLKQELAAKGLKRAREFSWERTAEGTMAVYRAVEQTLGLPNGKRERWAEAGS
jgi:glycosyltransferase involved in cell wall biosynthesis